jgi:hypothetical protein
MSTGESMASTEQLVVFTIGIGSIDPAQRVRNGEIEESVMQEAAGRLKTAEFYDQISPNAIPRICVDGRGRLDGQQELGANAAGGTFSVVMGDALTTNRYRQPGEKAPAHAVRVYAELQKMGYEIGGHDADHHGDKGCGCGAEDVLDNVKEEDPSIIRFMIQEADGIRAFLGENGVEVDDATHAMLVSNATHLYQEGYATNGSELCDAMKEVGGEASVETLTGSHSEFNLGINTERGTTLNRHKLRDAFGSDYQSFGLDVWALDNAARATSISDKEAAQKLAAMLYYNVAVAAVLAQNISVTTR